MAASSSSLASTASSAGSLISASLSATQSKPCSLFSSSSQTTSIKLDRGNYLFWESVVLSLIEGNQLESHIDGSPAPSQTLISEGAEVRNPASSNQSNRGGWRGGPSNPRGGFRGGRRGRGGRQGGPASGGNGSNRPFCYLCEKSGHIVSDCYFRFDKTFQPPKWQNSGPASGASSSSAQAYFATPQVVDDPSWYVDSGATHHVTPTTDQLDYYAPVGFLNRRSHPPEDSDDRIPFLVTVPLGSKNGAESVATDVGGCSTGLNGVSNGISTAISPNVQMSPTVSPSTTLNAPCDSLLNFSESLENTSRDQLDATNALSPVGSSSTSSILGPVSSQQAGQPSGPQAQQHHHMVTRAKDGIHKPLTTPMITGKQFSKAEGDPMSDPTLYRQAVGSLQYLTTTRPDISYSVNKLRMEFFSDESPNCGINAGGLWLIDHLWPRVVVLVQNVSIGWCVPISSGVLIRIVHVMTLAPGAANSGLGWWLGAPVNGSPLVVDVFPRTVASDVLRGFFVNIPPRHAVLPFGPAMLDPCPFEKRRNSNGRFSPLEDCRKATPSPLPLENCRNSNAQYYRNSNAQFSHFEDYGNRNAPSSPPQEWWEQ
ncbi:Retrovirus-related Pol polyprotein from transposon RE1 [Senna tora]|uniref:Retrovirus-related Pol polyprotein from transposon RE1 n=1 Tax=Senna tora TaxID=362788 RepID=A0A834SE41_9FABA|nr:Retrovirus-related Pol polyprotein from transposon RE1 [Senna tora]